MEAPPDFLAAVAATDFVPRYYELCSRYPSRLDVPPCKAPAAEVMRAARAAGPASKLPGPGRPFGFELPGEHGNGELVFVIQGRTTVETHFDVPFGGARVAGTFAILARDVSALRGDPSPDPPYPRPEFHSLDELAGALLQVHRLGSLLMTVGDAT